MSGCIVHARNGRISTSGLKSDVAAVFLDPDFLYYVKISAICVHLRQIYDDLIFAWILRTCWPKIRVTLHYITLHAEIYSARSYEEKSTERALHSQ